MKQQQSSNTIHRDKLFFILLSFLFIHLLFYLVFLILCFPHKNNLVNKNIMKGSQSSPLLINEYGYPKFSRVHSFPTSSFEKELSLHDRYIIHGIYYTDKLNETYLNFHWSLPKPYDQKVCMLIFMNNAKIPYINALLMSLMNQFNGFNTKHGYELLSYMEINVVDTERRIIQYDSIRQSILELPYIYYHHMPIVNISRYTSKRYLKLENYIYSVKICLKSGLQWCLMLQDYTILPLDFLSSLKSYVTSPLNSLLLFHNASNVLSIISLFSISDTFSKRILNITDVDYSIYHYNNDRGKLNSERKAMNITKYKGIYRMYIVSNQNGNNGTINNISGDSAMLFHRDVVKWKLIPFLNKMIIHEEHKLKNNIGNLKQDLHLEVEFPLYTGVKRRQIEPSLVNSIGFYRNDDYNQNNVLQVRNSQDKKSIIIPSFLNTHWLTDPRFLFDAGKYEEGRDFWFQHLNGSWLYDEVEPYYAT